MFKARRACRLTAPDLAKRDVAQKFDGLPYAFDGRKKRVLVLDGKNAVIADHAQGRAKLPPPFLAVAVAERDVVPAALGRLDRGARVENPVYRGRNGLDAGVLRVNVVDRRTQE